MSETAKAITPVNNRFHDVVVAHLRAGYQIILVSTFEESRVERELIRVAETRNMGIAFWDTISGFGGTAGGDDGMINPTEAIRAIPAANTFTRPNVLVVLKDLHPYMTNPDVVRSLKGIAQKYAFNTGKQQRPVVLVCPPGRVPPELQPYIAVIEFNLPDPEQLNEEVDKAIGKIKTEAKKNCPPDLRHKIIQSLRGLTATEAADCLSLCLIQHGGFVPHMIDTIETVKANMIKRSEILEYIPKDRIPDRGQIAGYDDILSFFRRAKLAYSEFAAEASLDMPKGVVVVGVPGTGKSVMAEIVARELELPLVIFNFSALFNALVGESERRAREVINIVTALGGCVLLIDEADKALTGSKSSTSDGGVTQRVFGVILTWLARKNDRTFVILTANRVEGMPPELLRKGRFDEIFYADIPDGKERVQILEIHMRKRGIDPARYKKADWSLFQNASNEFVGSECEEAIKKARLSAVEMAHIFELQGLMKAAQKAKDEAQIAEIRRELNSYSVDQQTAAFELTPDQIADMKKGIPTVSQLSEAMELVSRTRVMAVDKENIESIRKFGNAKACPVSSIAAGKLKKSGRTLDVDEEKD